MGSAVDVAGVGDGAGVDVGSGLADASGVDVDSAIGVAVGGGVGSAVGVVVADAVVDAPTDPFVVAPVPFDAIAGRSSAPTAAWAATGTPETARRTRAMAAVLRGRFLRVTQ